MFGSTTPLIVIAQAATDLEVVDWVIVGTYFAVVAVIAWWASRKQDDSEDYFLAGRNVGWFVIGGSLFASNIGSEHLVGRDHLYADRRDRQRCCAYDHREPVHLLLRIVLLTKAIRAPR